jgi:hypothetical protein
VAEKMGALFKRRELTDVVLVASDGRELAAHRAVLAAQSQVKCLKAISKLLIFGL